MNLVHNGCVCICDFYFSRKKRLEANQVSYMLKDDDVDAKRKSHAWKHH